MPVLALGWYEGPVRSIVLGWKLRGRVDVERVLRPQLGDLASALLAALGPGERDVWVVPVPSGLRRWWRGRPSVERLAHPVAEQLAASGVAARVVLALAPATGVRQRGQRDASSGRRREVAMRATLECPGAVVVLVDDVMTTGATLQAGYHAICRAGGRVLGAVVIAAARAPVRHTGARLSWRRSLD